MVLGLELQQRFPPREKIIAEGHRTHPGLGRATDLTVRAIPLPLEMAVGVQDHGYLALDLDRSVQRAVHIYSPYQWNSHIRDLIPIHLPPRRDDRRDSRPRRQWR